MEWKETQDLRSHCSRPTVSTSTLPCGCLFGSLQIMSSYTLWYRIHISSSSLKRACAGLLEFIDAWTFFLVVPLVGGGCKLVCASQSIWMLSVQTFHAVLKVIQECYTTHSNKIVIVNLPKKVKVKGALAGARFCKTFCFLGRTSSLVCPL